MCARGVCHLGIRSIGFGVRGAGPLRVWVLVLLVLIRIRARLVLLKPLLLVARPVLQVLLLLLMLWSLRQQRLWRGRSGKGAAAAAAITAAEAEEPLCLCKAATAATTVGGKAGGVGLEPHVCVLMSVCPQHDLSFPGKSGTADAQITHAHTHTHTEHTWCATGVLWVLADEGEGSAEEKAEDAGGGGKDFGLKHKYRKI